MTSIETADVKTETKTDEASIHYEVVEQHETVNKPEEPKE